MGNLYCLISSTDRGKAGEKYPNNPLLTVRGISQILKKPNIWSIRMASKSVCIKLNRCRHQR